MEDENKTPGQGIRWQVIRSNLSLPTDMRYWAHPEELKEK